MNNASEVEMYFEVATYFEWNRQVPILRPVQFPQGTGTEVDDEMIIGTQDLISVTIFCTPERSGASRVALVLPQTARKHDA